MYFNVVATAYLYPLRCLLLFLLLCWYRKGVIHYYPYDGEKETRPQAMYEEDDESTTIQTFWEGRLVPESHAAALSFFPLQKL